MILEEKMIAEVLVENMNSWKHRGFSVYYAQPIEACNDNGRKTLSEYISRAPFSFEKAAEGDSTVFSILVAGTVYASDSYTIPTVSVHWIYKGAKQGAKKIKRIGIMR